MHGKKHTDEAREKMSKMRSGKRLSQNHVRAITEGHLKRNKDKIERNAKIIHMVVNENKSYDDVVNEMQVPKNIVYGAMSRYRKSQRL